MGDIARMQQRLDKAAQSFGPNAVGQQSVSVADDLLALALSDIARHHGCSIETQSLVAGLPLVDGRLPLEHLGPAAQRAGLATEVVAADTLALKDVELPVILLLRDGGANVIWSIDRNEAGSAVAFLASAPGSSEDRVRFLAEDLAAASSGRIVQLRPRSDGVGSNTASATRDSSSWFLQAFSTSNIVYREAIAATIAINILALALPLFSMNVYDRVLPNAAAETLWSLSIGVILATLFDFLIKALRGKFVDTAGRRADVVLSNLIYSRLVGARLEGPAASAGVRANTMRELDTLREFYNSATLTAFGDLPFLVLFIAMIAAIAGSLVLIPLISIPIVLAIGWATQHSVGRLMEASIRQSAVKNAVVVETVIGLESIKAAGAESWAAAQWEKATAESIRSGNEIRHATNVGVLTVHAAQTLTQVAMIIAGFYMTAAGALTMGALIAATMLAGRAMAPLAQLALLIAKLHQTRLSYRLLSEIVASPQERPEGFSFVVKRDFSGSLDFESVTFRYEKDAPPVLDVVSFSIAPGERVGLVGSIGTGKSTVLRLVDGLKLPTDGRVLVDGIPTNQIDPAVLRSHVGLALQQAELFRGTIRSNIALADPGVDDESLLEAARVAGALDWIVRLPKGLETPVCERGAGLSGGQKQTIVLARALLRRPRIVLLDEPTSDLDPRTEQAVVERLRPWLEGRTALIVTHRPAMLALVDRLIVLDNGKKRLDGPKASVLASLAATTGLAVAKNEARKP